MTTPILPTVPPTVPTDAVAEIIHDTRAVQAIEDSLRAANQTQALANFANAATGVYGISGSGKSSLADTAAEFAWAQFHATSLCYMADLGGFGSKRISLVRLGIMRVWDPRNHVNPFETMELCSLGAWPETIDDPETGRAAPDVRLILPRRLRTTLICPQGHHVAVFDNSAELAAAQIPCPTCKVITSMVNGTTTRHVVRHRMFKTVGHRIYDSMTELNDWGMAELGTMSARGQLPIGKEGGSMLGSADALRQGVVVYGGGSPAQVGFMQNRTYGWIANIRAIPDQVLPATLTFAVEQGKADDDSGGVPILGPQIAGNARTAKVPRWVGNCLHASREPNDEGNMVHRLWLTTHLDRRDVRAIPYLAKHRGIPLDMPDYLEDPWHGDKATRDALAWSVCSLGVFYGLLQAQLTKLEAADRARYPQAPGLYDSAAAGDIDEVMGEVVTPSLLNLPSAGPRIPASAGQTLGARRAALRIPGQPPAPAAPAPAPTATTPAAPLERTRVTPVGAPPPPAPSPSPIVAQLEASLNALQAAPPTARPIRLRTPGGVRMPGVPGVPVAPSTGNAGAAASAAGVGSTAETAAMAPVPPPSPAPTAAAPSLRLPARRTPRPPV
ncbi:MAG: hypothetical protein V4792_16830 [Pseudomonadota bacterium]